ncbi:MAG: hypothetical protein JW793_12000, partial [Acidobacteria bacterium]|nr:hypothetical protein [Acidobacteriota bacterium]
MVEHGAGVILALLRWHLPHGNRQELEAASRRIWARALNGDATFPRWQAERTAREVGEMIQATGVKLDRREAADIANKIEAELRLEASKRGL